MSNATVRQQADGRPLLRSDSRPRMAKAHLPKAEMETCRAQIGHAIERAMCLAGWSLKEFASAVARDERQVARWMTGQERPQFDALFSVPTLRQPLVVALAELAGQGVEVQTVITVRRTA